MYIYKVNGKRIVDLLPLLSLKGFYDEMSFIDACRLSLDIRGALRTYGITPTLNRQNNLQMFVNARQR